MVNMMLVATHSNNKFPFLRLFHAKTALTMLVVHQSAKGDTKWNSFRDISRMIELSIYRSFLAITKIIDINSVWQSNLFFAWLEHRMGSSVLVGRTISCPVRPRAE